VVAVESAEFSTPAFPDTNAVSVSGFTNIVSEPSQQRGLSRFHFDEDPAFRRRLASIANDRHIDDISPVSAFSDFLEIPTGWQLKPSMLANLCI
jgi:hypothetical protein